MDDEPSMTPIRLLIFAVAIAFVTWMVVFVTAAIVKLCRVAKRERERGESGTAKVALLYDESKVNRLAQGAKWALEAEANR